MINIQDVSFRYGNKQPVFERLSLSLQPNGIYGLLGENGEGKSTLLRLIAGLLKPQAGLCDVLGHRPTNREPVFLESVFFLPETVHVPHTVIDRFVKLNSPFYRHFDHSLFESCMETFGLSPKLSFGVLSHGQQKKVMISFALATKAKVLLFDEPTNGLDIGSKAQFRKLIASTFRPDSTVLMATHQVRELEALIDSLVILAQHQVCLSATLEEITDILCFKEITDESLPNDFIFKQMSPRGQQVVVQNRWNESTKIDFEALFNATRMHPELIRHLFSQYARYEQSNF